MTDSAGRSLRVLMIGDVVGQAGCRALFIGLAGLVKRTRADLVIANGENAADGFGLTPRLADQMFQGGVHVITSGNHIWQQQEIFRTLDQDERVLRPANYPPGLPGRGLHKVAVPGFGLVGVINLEGRVGMANTDCPFRAGAELAARVRKDTRAVIVDFHAESLEEKEALAHHLDGQVSGLVGTHTHVQSADERILPNGTAYLTDLGMTGPRGSVIGFRKEISIQRALTQMPLRLMVDEGAAEIHGCVLSIDTATGRALEITRVRESAAV